MIGGLAGMATGATLRAEEPARWSPAWDQLLIRSALRHLDAQYDDGEHMLARQVGDAYNYHSALRNQRVHPTRDSLSYALLLLETDEEAAISRARELLARVIALQDSDPDSRWYGIWGYYLEEPPPQMQPADWNWADFNGATLLMIEYRHGAKLGASLREQVRESVRHAAKSVQRRNVSMSYTNIAVQGSFVTMAAAELLDDAGLRSYAIDRWQRFARTVDQTGSFAEYNSPTYARVTIENLTRMRMVIADEGFRALCDKIHHRAWLHVSKHWHPPTMQFAGPMSRCYSTDLGRPLWLQKSLGGRLPFYTEAEMADAPPEGETGVLEYACPDTIAPAFLSLNGEVQHRELFIAAEPPVQPVQGTTWLGKRFALGSVNRGDFWVQRRPLVGYWGGDRRPAQYAQLRVMKDDYDFASALLYSVQKRGCVTGIVDFRKPGGDRHISLDPIAKGEFEASRIGLRLDLRSGGEAEVLVNGKPAIPGQRYVLPARIAVNLGEVFVWFWPVGGRFGKSSKPLAVRLAREGELVTLSVDFLDGDERRLLRWADTSQAFVAFAMMMDEAAGSLRQADTSVARRVPVVTRPSYGTARVTWNSPAGRLGVTARTEVDSIIEQDRAFRQTVDGRPVPVVRLSDVRLTGSGNG
jgi:uncharacterized membrane protein YidH (DUF202 family)